MAVNRPDPRKMKPKKLLRDLKRIAEEHGAEFAGLDGGMHYLFLKNGAQVRAPSTPRDPDNAKRRFRCAIARA